jgi:hypothetical protein
VRIKALPLSQSKQKKRTKEVITIQRGKDSWSQRPQTLGSLTPPLTRASLHACPASMRSTTAPHPLWSALPPPMPPLQHTHRIHHCRQHQPPPLHRTCCRVAPAPSPPLAYKFPHQLPQFHPTQSKTPPIKPPLPNRKQLHFPLPHP